MTIHRWKPTPFGGCCLRFRREKLPTSDLTLPGDPSMEEEHLIHHWALPDPKYRVITPWENARWLWDHPPQTFVKVCTRVIFMPVPECKAHVLHYHIYCMLMQSCWAGYCRWTHFVGVDKRCRYLFKCRISRMFCPRKTECVSPCTVASLQIYCTWYEWHARRLLDYRKHFLKKAKPKETLMRTGKNLSHSVSVCLFP